MTEHNLIRYRLERSRETLKDAETLISTGSLVSAVNRMYYGMFYAVVALLKTKGFSSSKHSGVRALFNQHFVKTGIVSKEIGQFYGELFDRRMKGDYVDFTEFTLEQVNGYFEKCGAYTAQLESIVNGLIKVEENERKNVDSEDA